MADPYASIREEYRKSAYPDVHDDFTTWEEMLPCRDGVRLRTIFYRPVADEPVPTIVQRCCYPGQEGMIRVHGEELCKKGFALVCRCAAARAVLKVSGNPTSTSAATVLT